MRGARLVATLLGLMVFGPSLAGCVEPASSKGCSLVVQRTASALYHPAFERLHVRSFYGGAEPPDVRDSVQENWTRFGFTQPIIFDAPVHAPELDRGTWSRAQIVDAQGPYQVSPVDGTFTMSIIWPAGFSLDGMAGAAYGYTMVVYREGGLLDSPWIRAVLMHEFGHNLGLVNLGLPMVRPHEDPEHPAHSTNTSSIMYYALDRARDVAEVELADFDADDLADIANGRRLGLMGCAGNWFDT